MFIGNYDLFLFDADGVIYIGDQPCPNVVETIHVLQEKGKGVRILTNDSRFTRTEIQQKIWNMGIHLHTEDIITASWGVARYLQQQGFSEVQVVGSDALKEEIVSMGGLVISDRSPEAVIVGFNENLILRDIHHAIRSIEQGAILVATNYDISYPTPSGRQPATGSVVRLIESVTGKKAIVVGKPSSFIFQIAQEGYKKNPRTVMIGDSPDIDVLGGHQAGIPVILVTSNPVFYPTPRDYRIPDAQIRDLSEIFDPSFKLHFWKKSNFSWPKSIGVAVAALLFDPEGRVLLIKRRDNSYWALPTGRMELGETLEEAIVREMKEELNLKVKVKRLVGIYSHPDHQVLNYNSSEVIQFVTSCFLCELESGDLRNNQLEILESGFYHVTQFPHPMVISHKKWIEDGLKDDGVTVFL